MTMVDRPGSANRSVYLLVVPLAVFLLLACTPVAEARAKETGSEHEAVELLTKAAKAANRTAYRGVQEVRAWYGRSGCTQTLRVHHVPGRGTEITAASGTGAGRVTNVPDGLSAATPQLQLLTANYRVVRAGVASIAGRLAEIVDAKSAAGEVRARYWLDRATGLLLRRDVFDEDGRLARRSAFTSIDMRSREAPQEMQVAAGGDRGPSGREISLGRVGELRSAGWTVPKRLADRFDLYDVRSTGHAANTSLHLTYSDGISVLSVFEQRGHLDESHLVGWHTAKVGGRTVYLRDTVPRQLTWAGPGTVFTVVTDAPDRAVGSTVRMLPGAEERPGFWARVARGLARIVSWCNPF
ncbi:MAG: hypothetical protein GEV07_26805 [Streptosporangiales bacterium]|nr:hypothetical protein [Streptosporangiales bacterium]